MGRSCQPGGALLRSGGQPPDPAARKPPVACGPVPSSRGPGRAGPGWPPPITPPECGLLPVQQLSPGGKLPDRRDSRGPPLARWCPCHGAFEPRSAIELALGMMECQGGGQVLDDRKLAVLRAIVRDYVSTMEPVGSKALADRHHLDV